MVRKTGDMYTHHCRVPLAEICSPISEAFHRTCVDETETSDVEGAPGLGGVEVDWIAVLPIVL